MPIRLRTLWRVPVFCLAASWVSFYITVYLGGFFFIVQTVGADGIIQISADPLRSALFSAATFLLVLLTGGLWAFRSMTRAEISLSAGIASAFYLILVLAQLLMPNSPLSLSITLSHIQTWPGDLSSFLLRLTGNFPFSVIASSFAPLLFIPFGKRSAK